MSGQDPQSVLDNPALAEEAAEKLRELLAEARSLQAAPAELVDQGTLAWQESEDHRNEIEGVFKRAVATLKVYGLTDDAKTLAEILTNRHDEFFWRIQETRHEGEYLVVSELEELLTNLLYAIQPRRDRPIGESDPGGTVARLERICSRFHLVVGEFNRRHDGRHGITVEDEYDVQDVLRGLLRLFFEDVRPEDCVPSYSGGNSRTDFVLKDEKTLVEVKMTRDRLGDKEIGEQLGVDALRYRAHPDARTLVCFVYDPHHRLKNPRGLETDLSKLSDQQLRVIAFIRPQ